MKKNTLIEQIRQHNPTAAPQFLAGFDEPDLARYLSHLEYALRPRGPRSYWDRQGETPAVVARRH